MKAISAPKGVFKGKNFMTPEILGYFKLRRGYAELSTGRGMEGEPIFGVTVRPGGAGKSILFQSRRKAEGYIESLSDAKEA